MKVLKKSIIFLVVLLTFSNLFAKKAAVLPEIFDPATINVDENHIYISQRAEVFIYSLNDYHLIKKFGREGEGPREFPLNPYTRAVSVEVEDKYLLVNSINRVSYFSKDGEFIREIKGKGAASKYQPIKDKYIGVANLTEEGMMYTVINIYDSELNKLKELRRVKSSVAPGAHFKVLTNVLIALTHKERIFLLSSTDFEIDVLDVEGKKLFTIKRDYKRQEVDENFKKDFCERLRKNPNTRRYYEVIKNKIEFPGYFPAAANFYITDDILYIITYKRQGDKFEFFVYDLNGKFLEQMYVRIKMKSSLEPYPVCIKNHKLYQLVENDNEDWEFHISTLE